MKDSITVDDVVYRRADDSGQQLRIVICDNRGLTFIGRCDLSGDDEQVVIRGARCIIYWGTTEHLAELVSGPTDTTKLGRGNDVTVFRRNLVASYAADEEGWRGHV